MQAKESNSMKTPTQKPTRDSNIELLRILAMFMVMILHFNNHGFANDILDFQGALTITNTVGHFLESFAIIAVNVFVLISGLYGIRFKGRGLLSFYLQCFFCGLVAYLLYILFTGEPITTDIFKQLLAFTHNKWWFVVTYLYLYLTAPLLNYAVENMPQKTFQWLLLAWAILTFYFGYSLGYDDGMSYVNFVFLYLIGRYIGVYISQETLCQKRWWSLLLFIGCCLGTFAVAITKQHYQYDILYLRPYIYNSWWVIGGAIGLVLFVKSFSFQSRIINWIGGSVFAAYLLQESPYLGFKVVYPLTETFFGESTLAVGYEALLLLAFSAVFLLVAVLIDKLGKWLFKPLLSRIK